MSDIVSICCLHPGCDKVAYLRGNCNSHYTKRCKQVSDGKTTWEQLEESGLVLPRKKRSKPWSKSN